jgi:hypothetical protein
MLADDLIATAGSADDRTFGGAFTLFAKSLRVAQRFDLSPDVMRSAFTVAHSPIGGQLRALPLTKLPFRLTWFEWPGGFAGDPSTRTDCHAPVPKRLGALVETDASLQRGSIMYAWRHTDDHRGEQGANICPIAVTFDWRAEPAPLPDLSGAELWGQGKPEEWWREQAEIFPRLRGAAPGDILDDHRRFGMIINPMMQKFMDYAEAHSGKGYTALLDAATLDIKGEPVLLRAALMLMNSRNLASHEKRPAPPRLNAARARRGKAPLLDYTHVHIRLTRALGQRAGMAADPRAPARLHLVRGHFKIRAGGIFWWAPHARGHAFQGEVKTQHHSVAL